MAEYYIHGKKPYFREELGGKEYGNDQARLTAIGKFRLTRLMPEQDEEEKKQAEIDRLLIEFINAD